MIPASKLSQLREIAVLVATAHVQRLGVPEPEARERGELLIAIDEAREQLCLPQAPRRIIALTTPALHAVLLATCAMNQVAA